MWFAGGRRLLYLCVVGILVISVLLIWVCSYSCQVGAIRISASSNNASSVAKVKLSYGVLDNKSKQDLLHKYFSGRRAFGPSTINASRKGFDESKRRVPSCPDPLHN